MLTIANAYVGMRNTLAPLEALGRIRQAVGARFDPQLVEVLAGLLQESGELGAPEQEGRPLAVGRLPYWML